MEYFVYVSDAKLDMLAGQLPPDRWRKLARELKIDLKVLGVSLRDDPRPETRYSKLRLVERYLTKEDEVGTVAQPRSWFGGTAALAWGTVGTQGEVAYFTNVVDGTLLGLTGSSKHLLDRRTTSYVDTDPERYAPGGSSARVMVETEWARSLATTGLDAEAGGRFAQGDAAAVATMLGIHRRLYGRTEPLRYLAKRLLELPASEVDLRSGVHRSGSENTPVFERILLGTPLYVAMAD